MYQSYVFNESTLSSLRLKVMITFKGNLLRSSSDGGNIASVKQVDNPWELIV